jgi:hypothetical protein
MSYLPTVILNIGNDLEDGALSIKNTELFRKFLLRPVHLMLILIFKILDSTRNATRSQKSRFPI